MNPYIDDNGYLVFTINENECNNPGCLVEHIPFYVPIRYKVNTNTGLFEEVRQDDSKGNNSHNSGFVMPIGGKSMNGVDLKPSTTLC